MRLNDKNKKYWNNWLVILEVSFFGGKKKFKLDLFFIYQVRKFLDGFKLKQQKKKIRNFIL